MNSALHAVRAGIDPAAVRGHLETLPGVAAIHDLHIWPMGTTETALTCHCDARRFIPTTASPLPWRRP